MKNLFYFDDLIDKYQNCNKNLLLGNGFSIACNKDFCYNSILEKSSFRDSILFSSTSDFEKVIDDLNFERDVYKFTYEEDYIPPIYENLSDDLKKALVNTLVKIHSNVYTNKEQNENTFLFLSNFNNIFTLNYDLLLYWVIIYAANLQRDYPDYYYSCIKQRNYYPRDGFIRNSSEGDCIWSPEIWKQNVFYLHGGLHLFYDNKQNMYKLTYDLNNNQSIIDKTRYWLEHGTSSLVVIEGNSSYKLQHIRNNNYLNYCYEKLCNIQDILFIPGHSFGDKDYHIYDAIDNNPKIKMICISIHKPTENIEEKFEKANATFETRINEKSLEIKFYDADSVKIW